MPTTPDPTRRPSSRTAPTFRNDHLTQIAMPMGGLGAGNVCLNGIGGLQDFSIHNRPALSALPDGWSPAHAAFALVHVKGRKPRTRLAEGPVPAAWISDRGLQSQGFRRGGHEGLPRFRTCIFTNEFPFGHVDLSDPDLPIDVRITGWSPFIPGDDRNSGMPCAILEYTLINRSRTTQRIEFSYHVSHWATGSRGDKGTRTQLIDGGVLLTNTEAPTNDSFGSASLSVIGHNPVLKASWFRGAWFDAVSVIWRECEQGTFRPSAPTTADVAGRNGASLMVPATMRGGQSVTIPILLTWHFPNVDYVEGRTNALPIACGSDCACDPPEPSWRPWYATQWRDAGAVAAHVRENYAALRRRTRAFRDALAGSTVPAEVIDAVASNLAILKSPTILRQSSGNLWQWEGCFPNRGCCHGSCTHVWNYAQAIPHLFPALERTLREQELERSMDESGHVNFRAALPDGPTTHSGHPAADGQLGGIMKLYRDWQISGDDAWMARLYPLARRSLDYCIGRWDPQESGMLVEPHHNTYDIEFWGPDSMCTSIYVGALSAMALLSDAMRDGAAAARYRALAERGAAAMSRELFNGAYYQQKVMWRELRDRSFADRITRSDGNDETLRIEQQEGPKYQYGDGCLSDGVIGAWMASLYGIDAPFDRKQVRRTLKSIVRHNVRHDLTHHACAQRPGYAMGTEGGLLLCTWPRGNRLTLPFPYSDEVWTGIEYQVASHLILEGMADEGLSIVRTARRRHDGRVRNPFNEYECGNYYARALASYALLLAFSGFRYAAATRTLTLSPRSRRPFRSFFSVASGFGTVTLGRASLTIEMIEGTLDIEQVRIKDGRRILDQTLAVQVTPDQIFTLPLRPQRVRARG